MRAVLALLLSVPASANGPVRVAEAPVSAALPVAGTPLRMSVSFAPVLSDPLSPVALVPMPPAILGPAGPVWEGKTSMLSLGADGMTLGPGPALAHVADLTDPARSPVEAAVFRQVEGGLRQRGWRGEEIAVANQDLSALAERVDWLWDPAVEEVLESRRAGTSPSAALDKVFDAQKAGAVASLEAVGVPGAAAAVAKAMGRVGPLGAVLADLSTPPAVKRMLLQTPVLPVALGIKPAGWQSLGYHPEDDRFLAGRAGMAAARQALARVSPDLDQAEGANPPLVFSREATLKAAIAHARTFDFERLLRATGSKESFRAAMGRMFDQPGPVASIGVLLGYPLRDVLWYRRHDAGQPGVARLGMDVWGGFIPDNMGWVAEDPSHPDSVRRLAFYDTVVDLARERLLNAFFGVPPRAVEDVTQP